MTMRKAIGFTLIELLVVIAIIAMLAAILVPAVNKALISAALVQTVSNGKNIYTSAFADQMDNAVLGGNSSGWPSNGNATAYFITLVTSQVMNVSFDFFAAKGVTAVKTTNSTLFADKNNAWRLTTGLTDGTPEGTAFLVTKNYDGELTTFTALDNTMNPFGDAGVVVVQKGGSAVSLKGNQRTIENLNASGYTLNLTLSATAQQ